MRKLRPNEWVWNYCLCCLWSKCSRSRTIHLTTSQSATSRSTTTYLATTIIIIRWWPKRMVLWSLQFNEWIWYFNVYSMRCKCSRSSRIVSSTTIILALASFRQSTKRLWKAYGRIRLTINATRRILRLTIYATRRILATISTCNLTSSSDIVNAKNLHMPIQRKNWIKPTIVNCFRCNFP